MIFANGWVVRAHPLLLDQLERLAETVQTARTKDPDGYASTADAKVLAALRQLIFDIVPQDPTRAEYRQGRTLGKDYKHWFRAKFGNGRFRLFFRFDSRSKVLIFAWVNDQHTLRTYGAKTDAYAVFRGMLNDGDPPNDWPALLKAASTGPIMERFAKAALSQARYREQTSTSPKKN